MNTLVGKGFSEEKIANLKVFIANVCETYRRQHFIHENSQVQQLHLFSKY